MKNFMKIIVPVAICFVVSATALPQTGKKISPDLFGLFFEDINYSADGGLYAELVQNRSFEYNPTERREWNPFSYWEYVYTRFFIRQNQCGNLLPCSPQ